MINPPGWLAATLLAVSSTASAVCIETPLEQRVESAKVIFVATLTQARMTPSPTALMDRDRYRIDYAFAVGERLKGDPSSVATLYAIDVYDAPGDGRTLHYAETPGLVVGEHVLVIGDGAREMPVGLCVSGRLDERELATVRALLPPNAATATDPAGVMPGAVVRERIVPFTQEKYSAARRFGIRLGAPYDTVAVGLTQRGWRIEPQVADAARPEKEGFTCGAGYDAICGVVWKRGDDRILLLVNPRTETYSVESVAACGKEGC